MKDEMTRPARRASRPIVIAHVDDFPPGTRREVQVGRAVIAVFNIEGEFHAIYGICPHQFAPLAQGKLQGTVICNADTGWEVEWAYEGEVLVCPGHAMEFHVRTGEAIGYGYSLRTYEVIVKDSIVTLMV